MVTGASAFGLSGLPLDLFAENDLVKITLLHTNDVHSHIDPFPLNHPSWPGLGGVARRAALIDKIRKNEKNVLLFDSGDIFQGTPYFNMYGGELELKLMSEMNYDAATIGNHDFDNGLAGLLKQLPHATFPFINSNYDFTETSMNEKTIQSKIFTKENVRVGVFGLGIELKGLVDRKLYGNTLYLDPIKKTQEMTRLLKHEMNCDLVVCLSHLGYSYTNQKISDVILAEQTSDIDFILGGHTHTFLDEPVRVKNRTGKDVYIAQAGWAGLQMGRIDVYVEKKSGKKSFALSTVKIF